VKKARYFYQQIEVLHMTYQSPNHKENVKKYKEKHKDRLIKERKDSYRSNIKKYVYHMLKRAENRAKRKNVPFNLLIEDIDMVEFCPILGIKFSIGDGKGPGDMSPSLDRIDPKLGYVKDNVMIISMKANKIKSDATLEEIEKVYNYLKTTKA